MRSLSEAAEAAFDLSVRDGIAELREHMTWEV